MCNVGVFMPGCGPFKNATKLLAALLQSHGSRNSWTGVPIRKFNLNQLISGRSWKQRFNCSIRASVEPQPHLVKQKCRFCQLLNWCHWFLACLLECAFGNTIFVLEGLVSDSHIADLNHVLRFAFTGPSSAFHSCLHFVMSEVTLDEIATITRQLFERTHSPVQELYVRAISSNFSATI